MKDFRKNIKGNKIQKILDNQPGMKANRKVLFGFFAVIIVGSLFVLFGGACSSSPQAKGYVEKDKTDWWHMEQYENKVECSGNDCTIEVKQNY